MTTPDGVEPAEPALPAVVPVSDGRRGEVTESSIEPVVVEIGTVDGDPMEPAGTALEVADPIVGTPELGIALDLVLGAAAMLSERAERVGRVVGSGVAPLLGVLLRPPLVGRRLQPGSWLEGVARRGHVERALVRAQAERIFDQAVPLLTSEVLARVDRDTLRALVEEIIDAVDLPEIIRESSGSVALDTLNVARVRAMSSDESVSRIVDRLLRRRRSRDAAAEAPEVP